MYGYEEEDEKKEESKMGTPNFTKKLPVAKAKTKPASLRDSDKKRKELAKNRKNRNGKNEEDPAFFNNLDGSEEDSRMRLISSEGVPIPEHMQILEAKKALMNFIPVKNDRSKKNRQMGKKSRKTYGALQTLGGRNMDDSPALLPVPGPGSGDDAALFNSPIAFKRTHESDRGAQGDEGGDTAGDRNGNKEDAPNGRTGLVDGSVGSKEGAEAATGAAGKLQGNKDQELHWKTW